jgi:hypothetical protein
MYTRFAGLASQLDALDALLIRVRALRSGPLIQAWKNRQRIFRLVTWFASLDPVVCSATKTFPGHSVFHSMGVF